MCSNDTIYEQAYYKQTTSKSKPAELKVKKKKKKKKNNVG